MSTQRFTFGQGPVKGRSSNKKSDVEKVLELNRSVGGCAVVLREVIHGAWCGGVVSEV